jgi:carboxyl-terminal processing protease
MQSEARPQGRLPSWLTWLASGWALWFAASGCQRVPTPAPAPPSTQTAPTVAHGQHAPPGPPAGALPGPGAPSSPTELATLSTVPFAGGEAAFRTIKDTLREKYYRPGLTDDELYRAAVAGMLQLLEPQLSAWNKLMSPEELRELHSDMQGSIVGIGVEIRFEQESGISDVLSVIPGSPAERSGLRDGDKILTVGGKQYRGKTLQDVVGDLRGKPGEVVSLTALRGGEVLPLHIRRERVAYDQVKTLLLPGEMGYVFIRQFTASTPTVLGAALRDLQAKRARALVIDLRGNQGGLLDKALSSAELFLKAGTPITQLQHRAGQRETLSSKAAEPVQTLPVALLIDHETASSAELLAGALHEGIGAHLIGARTYGKGTVQRVEELPNGYAYKYTASHFLLPSGQPIEGRGLLPDIEVSLALPGGQSYERQLSRVQHITDGQERLRVDAPLRAAVHVLRLALR